MHKLSAKFYTAVAAVFAHVKTSPEMCWQTVETKVPFGLGLEDTETPI